MKTLAFDTSTGILTIAVLDGAEVKSEYHEDVGIQHSKVLVSVVDDVLERAGWKLSEIDLICVGMGPGSFTGLRIAVSTVKGFASVINAKIAGVPTMDAMVMNAVGVRGSVAPLMDAKKGKVYSCLYDISEDGIKNTSEHMLIGVEELLAGLKKKTIFFGDGIEKYSKILDSCQLAEPRNDIDIVPRAVNIAKIGIDRVSKGSLDPAYLEPMYLHDKECNITIPKDKG